MDDLAIFSADKRCTLVRNYYEGKVEFKNPYFLQTTFATDSIPIQTATTPNFWTRYEEPSLIRRSFAEFRSLINSTYVSN